VDQRDELRALSSAVLDVAGHRAVRDVLQTILESATRLLDAAYGALGVPDRKGSFAEFLAVGLSDEQWRAIGPVPRQHGLLGVMLCDPSTVRLTDIRAHEEFGGWPSEHPELTDFIGLPIMAGDEILGELFLANKRAPGGFTADDEELLQLLAGHAAIALVNARLFEKNRELSIVEERTRLARELHDAVTQKLFSLRLTADAAAALLARDPERAAAELSTVRALARELTDELRAVVDNLRPADLIGDGLDAALAKQVDLLDRVHGATVRLTGGPVPRLAPEREEAVYRVAQEALHNALRHGSPRSVTIDLRDANGTVTLTVTDDGAGFDPRAQEAAGRRLGLASMRERARAVGARLDVRSHPGGGTTIRLAVPR
jgi:signal transduction histidine kinase